MKFFSLATLCLFVGLSIICASPLETKAGTKITKNEAEHIALKQHRGARVTAAKLNTAREGKVWSIEIAQGERRLIVTVNAMSGHIVSAGTDHR
ncbi:MAG: PepSY domain-containing protein [Chthoniobacterales bacterium]|nr:PepSY domain-containing protein [Chthoniobacterales bacterium]